MRTALPEQIESLFTRCPALCGFSVRGLDELPDNCARGGEDGCELFVGDIGISPALSREQFGKILRGRTFARVLQ